MTIRLKDINRKFKSKKDCLVFLENNLWASGPVCPYCKTSFYSSVNTENRYHCNKCNSSFSVTVGTMFHRTRCDLQKWFLCILLIPNLQPSVRQLASHLEVTKDTANLLTNKIKIDKKNFDILYKSLINIFQYEKN